MLDAVKPTDLMPTTKELRATAKARKIPKYYKLNKTQLLGALGMREELKAHKMSGGKSKAIAAQSKRLSGGDTTAQAILKGRLARAVARDLRKAGENLSQAQKRELAMKAVKREAQQIKRGTPEVRGGAIRKAGEKITPAQRKRALAVAEQSRGDRARKSSSIPVSAAETMSVRDRREKLRRQFDPNSSGTRSGRMAAKEEKRAIVGLGGEKVAREEALERPKLQVIAGGEKSKRIKDMSLKELFGEADRVGAKYQDKNDPIDLSTRRQAKQIMDEVGMTALSRKAQGVGDLDAKRRAKAAGDEGRNPKAKKTKGASFDDLEKMHKKAKKTRRRSVD